ncbi:hypothetical protein Vadar_007406 [Vaccinium darrowii]|uniref:Uncharacterized protein n=1 Tax=Vaccinium darrowii TaxID=229202 RepID=A0ACB7XP73_9ERIC|nr:hypothetical protein Vadar_007406 [Vaccinium darrowii]
MSITRDYSYRIEKKYFCEKRPLPYDQSVRVLVHLRRIPHDDPEIDFSATTLVPHATLLSDAAGPTLSPILSSLGIPSEDQTRVVHDIPSFSTSLNFLETCSRCHRFLVPGIVLVIRANEVEAVEEVDEIDHDIKLPMKQRTMPADELMHVPATEYSIQEALDKLRFDAGTWGLGTGSRSRSAERCTIC